MQSKYGLEPGGEERVSEDPNDESEGNTDAYQFDLE
jgi:hypothetical protein